MKQIKRWAAFVLTWMVLLTTGYSDVLAASLTTGITEQSETAVTQSEQTENTEAVDTEQNEDTKTVDAEKHEDTEAADAEQSESTEAVDAEQSEATETVDAEQSEATETAEVEQSTDTKAAITEESTAKVNYLVVESPMVQTLGTQRIMLGIGDGTQTIDAAELSVYNRKTKETSTVKAAEISGDFVLFTMDYAEDTEAGVYQLNNITYTCEGSSYTAAFRDMGIDAAFGVNQSVESEPDDVLLTDEEVAALAAETDMNIVTLDSEGNAASETALEEAMANAGCEENAGAAAITKSGAKGESIDATGMNSLVVVLDPGHGGSDPGSQANGIVEKTVNLKIAQYCKAELEEYAGVTVYMTRTGDTYLSLADRAQVAADKKADVFISLHNNSNTSSVPSGANVYYPNSNYNANCGATGSALANVILSKLTDLGLASGGIHIRNSENGTKYPDGSLADYYGVIKRCKENGIPGLIVEHAFVSNSSDAQKYLSTDEQLKKLGIADATGIAEYYGLSKGLGFNSVQSLSSTTMTLTWTAQTGVTGYCIYRSTSSGDGFSKVAEITPATTTTWKDTGLKPGTTYYYKIRTYTKKSSSTKYGKYSPIVSGTTMQRPEISSVKSKSSKELVISWDTVNNAANYEIYRATKADGTFQLIANIAGINRVNYTDTKVTAGKLYYYKIRSVGQVNNTTIYSDYSEIVSGRTATVPSSLSVKSADSNTLRISWKADANMSGYVIKRATSATGKYKKVGTVTDGEENYYDDDTVKENTTYYYIVQSYNHNNDVKGYSGYSGVVSGKTIPKTKITKIVSTSSKKQTISWKKTNGVDGYIIYQSTAKNGKYKKIATIKSANTTTYKISGLKAGTRYYYKVRTRNKVNGKVGYGSYSTIRNAWTGAKPKVTVAGSTGTRIQVSWNPVGGADSYTVYRADSAKGTYKKIGTVSSEKTSYTDKKLKMTKKYYYRVEASIKGYKASGTSGMSKAVSGYPVRTTNILSAVANEQGGLDVTWTKVKDVKGYRIYRSTQQNGTYDLLTTISDYNTTSYTDTGVQSGMTYYYKIMLINQYDGKTVYGGYSAAVSGTLLAAPQNVTVTSIAENQLDISWSAVSGASGYVICRSTELNGTYTEIGAVASASVTTYSDNTVTKGVTYYYKVKAIDNYNNSSVYSSAASGCAVAKLVINGVQWGVGNQNIQITWTQSVVPVTGYEIYKTSSTDVKTQTKVAVTTDTSCIDTGVTAGTTYYYRVRPYTTQILNGKASTLYGIFSDTVSTNSSDYRIMGSAGVTPKQMSTMYLASGKKYPSSVYKTKGAATLDDFCRIVYEEASAEGVKPEVLFAQICHETAYLQFGGQVKASQCNFGGLGALDGGSGGATFADVRTGVRTQVQHLKAYASTNPLVNDCIDGRFRYISRGSAEYVQQLGKGNWATDTSYDTKLMVYIKKMLAS